MKLSHCVFLNTINLAGTTYGYVDNVKHKLEIDLKDNYISIRSGSTVVYTPVANVRYFEFGAPAVETGNFAGVPTVDLPKKVK